MKNLHVHKHIFLSAVSAEFRSYRILLAEDLTRPNLDVKVQEDFIAGGGTTLEKLDDYIRLCDAVVHLIGYATGSISLTAEIRTLCERYPDLPNRLPQLAQVLSSEHPQISYTQWEAYLAIYHRKPLFIYRAKDAAPRDTTVPFDESQKKAQQIHYERICELGRDRGEFADQERLSSLVLRSLHDILPATIPTTELSIVLPNGVVQTQHLLGIEDFHVAGDNGLKPLVVGFRPSLTMLRDRQYMPRPEHLTNAQRALTQLFGDRAQNSYQELDVFWITGRSGSGKSVLLLQLMEKMVREGRRVVWLDDDAAVLLPLLKILHPDSSAPKNLDLIFIDDLYTPQGQQVLDIDAIRRLVGSAPEQQWPIVVTCGPPEFERQFERDASREGINVHSWRLPPVLPEEATNLHQWFLDRMGANVETGRAFEQSEGLIVSMTFEIRHGRLEPFARRFRDRLQASRLDDCLRVPLALNRLYIMTPTSWLDQSEWERLDELNRDADFSVLESAHGSSYLRLTHPHISDSIYRAIRIPGSELAYANDLAEAFQRAWETDLLTLKQLLRVVVLGNERLDVIDMDALAEAVGRNWQQADLKLLQTDPVILAEVYTLLAAWCGRRPDLKLDERFGRSLLEHARNALRDVGERWPYLWKWLNSAYPDNEQLYEDAFGWLERSESETMQWYLIWRDLEAGKSKFSSQDYDRLMMLGMDWLKRNHNGDGWSSVMETLLSVTPLPTRLDSVQLLEEARNWLERKINRSGWKGVWEKLLSDKRLDKAHRIALLHMGLEWLKNFEIRRDWGWIWARLLAENELPPGLDRVELLLMGRKWLEGRERQDNWSFIWERLLDETELPPGIDSQQLLSWGQRLLMENSERRDWTFIWERLIGNPNLSDSDREALMLAGYQWLDGHESRKDWAFIWQHLQDVNPLPEGVDRRMLLKTGENWLEGREERKSWIYIWQNLVRAAAEWPEFLEMEHLLDVGKVWINKNLEHTAWPIIAAYVIRYTSRPEQHDELAQQLAFWLKQNSKNTFVNKVLDILLLHPRASESFSSLPGFTGLYNLLAAKREIFEQLQQAIHDGRRISGTIQKKLKKGFLVDLDGIPFTAFLPWSQVDVQKITNWQSFIGLESEFEIINLDFERLSIVVSRRILLARELAAHHFERLKVDDIVKGTVKNIVDYGVFVDLGGVDGFIYISDLSWGRINHPSEVVRRNEEIDVVILDIDKEKSRITLGYKQLQKDPWENITERLMVGSKITGKVIKVLDYGAFIEIEHGIEGLLHISEMSWSSHMVKPSQILQKGDLIEAVLLSIEPEERNICLSLKQLTPDPWLNIKERYPIGSRQKGVVKNLTSFGAFVELEEGIDGLIHISDLSWTRKIRHPREVVRKSDIVEIIILKIDQEERRLQLGYKQVEPNPWDRFADEYKVNTETSGNIVRMMNMGVIVELPLGVDGFVPLDQLGIPDIQLAADHFKIGDTLPLIVTEFDKPQKRIVLSVNHDLPGD